MIVQCPHCAENLAVEDCGYADGSVYSCPKCQGEFSISPPQSDPMRRAQVSEPKKSTGARIVSWLSTIAVLIIIGYNIWAHWHNAKIIVDGGPVKSTVKSLVVQLVDEGLNADALKVIRVRDFCIGDREGDALVDVKEKQSGVKRTLKCLYKIRTDGEMVEIYDFTYDDESMEWLNGN